MQDLNLPDGCTQADIDRAMGAVSPDLERILEIAEAQYEDVRIILAELEARTTDAVEAFERVNGAYIRAEAELQSMRNRLTPMLAARMDEAVAGFNDLDIPRPNAAAREACRIFPSWDDFRDDIIENWEENPDG